MIAVSGVWRPALATFSGHHVKAVVADYIQRNYKSLGLGELAQVNSKYLIKVKFVIPKSSPIPTWLAV
jgi:hypothetical protein